MAGPFAPTINANVAYESPVAPVSPAPSFAEGILDVASMGVSMYGQQQRSSGGGAGKPDPNLKIFSEELDKVAEIRATQGEMAGRLAERKVASNFAAAGIDFDKSYKAVYETKTGRQFDAYGRDDEEYQQNKLMESEEYRSIRAASFVALDPNTTEEARQTWSLNRLQEIKGAAYAVQKSKTDATYEWLTPSVGKDGEALPAIQQQYKVLLDSFSQESLAQLDELIKSGVKPTAENFAQIRARFAILDRQLERPQGLQDALWKPFEDEVKEVKDLINTIESVYSVETLSETVIQDLVARVRSSKDYTEVQKNIVATNILAKNTEVMKMLFNQGIGNRLGDFMKSLANLPMQKKVDFDLFGSDWYRKQGNGGPPDPNADTDISKIDPKIVPKTEFTTEEKVRQIRGNGSFAALLDPNEATKPSNIADTANQILAMGVTMNSGNNVDFFGDELTANVTDPNILKTVNGLAINNSAKGIPAKSLYRTGLKKEYSRMNQNLEAMEESLQGVTFDQATGKYVVDRKFFGKFANDLAAFEAGIQENYGGDFNRAAEDSFRAMMPTGSIGRDQVGNPMNIVAVGNFKNLSKAIKRRRNMSTILGAIDTLTEKPATGMEAPISSANEEGVVTIPSEVPLPPVRPQEDLATTRARQLQERRRVASEVLGTNIGDQRGLMQTPAYTPPETPEQPASEERSILQRIGEFFLGSPAAAAELPPDLRDIALSYARQGRPEEAGEVPVAAPSATSQRVSEALSRAESRTQGMKQLNEEALSEVKPEEKATSWLGSLTSAVAKTLFGSEAEAAELEDSTKQAIQYANRNPIDFIYKSNLVGLDENNPDHQEAISGFINRFVPGRVKNPSEVEKDANAWCAAFAGHVLTNLGVSAPQGAGGFNALRAAEYKKLGKEVSRENAQSGDLVIIRNPIDGSHHVGFFVNSSDQGVAVLGGNQNDQVNVTRYPNSRDYSIRRIDGMKSISPEALKAVQSDISEFAGQSLTNLFHRFRDYIGV